MNDVDKYFANRCNLIGEWLDKYTYWTIKDPRCREKVRERYGITTEPSIYDEKGKRTWTASTDFLKINGVMMVISETRDSLEKAEIACCDSIYEAERHEEII